MPRRGDGVHGPERADKARKRRSGCRFRATQTLDPMSGAKQFAAGGGHLVEITHAQGRHVVNHQCVIGLYNAVDQPHAGPARQGSKGRGECRIGLDTDAEASQSLGDQAEILAAKGGIDGAPD